MLNKGLEVIVRPHPFAYNVTQLLLRCIFNYSIYNFLCHNIFILSNIAFAESIEVNPSVICKPHSLLKQIIV